MCFRSKRFSRAVESKIIFPHHEVWETLQTHIHAAKCIIYIRISLNTQNIGIMFRYEFKTFSKS
jgi:hypothetical protein